MKEHLREKMFKEFDSILFEYSIMNPEDIFRLLNEYQNSKLNGIEKANNDKNRFALQRTIDYYDIELMDKWKRTKSEESKKKLIFKIVNNLCCYIDSVENVNCSNITKEQFNICIQYKDYILQKEDWYIKIIPESKWLLDYLKVQ